MNERLMMFIAVSTILAACTTTRTSGVNSTDYGTAKIEFSGTSTSAPTLANTPTPTPVPNHPTNRIIKHPANETIIYDWYSYVPDGLDTDSTIYILITGIIGGIYDYDDLSHEARMMLEERLRWPEIENFVLLVPVIPRRDSPHVYPVAFDLNSFSVRDDFYHRADLKVILMIDELIDELALDGYKVSERVLIEGFSSGGMFAQRFSLLHPTRVKAIAGGHCGGNFTLPISEYDGYNLNWPVGINNLRDLADIPFDEAAYKKISQFIYIGSRDTGEGGSTIVWNRLHPTWGPQYMWESVKQMEFLHTTFGETDPVRLENQVEYLTNIGFPNIEFRVYPGVGHQLNSQMISTAMSFLLT